MPAPALAGWRGRLLGRGRLRSGAQAKLARAKGQSLQIRALLRVPNCGHPTPLRPLEDRGFLALLISIHFSAERAGGKMRAGPFLWSQFFLLKNESDQVAFPYPEQLLSVAQPGDPFVPGMLPSSSLRLEKGSERKGGRGPSVPLAPAPLVASGPRQSSEDSHFRPSKARSPLEKGLAPGLPAGYY